MNGLLKYGLIAVAIGGFFLYSQYDGEPGHSDSDIDLNAVLDVTVDTLYDYNDRIAARGEDNIDPDTAFIGLADELAQSYNRASPSLHDGRIGVSPGNDASLLAYEESNDNAAFDEGEDALFLIEIDGENARIIATSRSGAVNDHHFSGTGLLAGYLIGSMLSRQRAAGVTSSSLARKQPVSARTAARARAGSGSHSSGK